MFSTLMTPARLTAAEPLNPKLIPKAPRLSLLLAVTATPRKLSVPFVITRGPSALASPDGVLPRADDAVRLAGVRAGVGQR